MARNDEKFSPPSRLAADQDDVEADVCSPSPNGYLSDLPASIKRLPYHSLQQCMAAREAEWQRQDAGKSEACELMLFTGVDEETFKRDFFYSHEKEVWRTLDSYDSDNNFLLIKMEKSPHNVASGEFIDAMRSEFASMGLKRKVCTLSNTGVDLFTGHIKVPDAQFIPKEDLPLDRHPDWPTVVLETAFSESERKLGRDVGRWLYESGGDVKVAMTIIIKKRIRQVKIQKWILREDDPYRVNEQSIIMTLVDDEVQFDVETELRISFQQLMLRDPLEPHERDVVITREALEDIAREIWERQERHEARQEEKRQERREARQEEKRRHA